MAPGPVVSSTRPWAVPAFITVALFHHFKRDWRARRQTGFFGLQVVQPPSCNWPTRQVQKWRGIRSDLRNFCMFIRKNETYCKPASSAFARFLHLGLPQHKLASVVGMCGLYDRGAGFAHSTDVQIRPSGPWDGRLRVS